MTNETLTYLDHAATTPVREEVIDAMLPYLRDGFANPSSAYGSARKVRRAVDDAHDEFAELVGASGNEVVFTSGGTEADNLAVLGVAHRVAGDIAVSSVEHKAVLAPAALRDAVLLPVDGQCVVDTSALLEMIGVDTTLVSVMAVNNETGVIQPLSDIAKAVRDNAPHALLHCDAVQAFPFLDIAPVIAQCDLVSFSAHKFGGPKGIGALIVRRYATGRIRGTHVGGSQEQGRRAGTENVAGIIGMATAARIWSSERAAITNRVRPLRDRFVDALTTRWPGVVATVPRQHVVANIAHLWFPGIASEELVMVLDNNGVCASAGSACMSGALEPSHVLLAMGRNETDAQQVVRFSFGWTSTSADVDQAVSAIGRAFERLGEPNFLRE